MKKTIVIFLLLVVGTVSCQDSNVEQKPAARSSEGIVPIDSIRNKLETNSYIIGIDMGRSLKSQYIDVDYAALIRGIMDGMGEDEWLMTEEEYVAAVDQFQTEQRVNYQQKRAQLASMNKEANEKFFAENKLKDGIIELPSGLQYRVIKSGNGPSPSADDVVTTHYTGRLIDGTVFDSSVERGQPFKTPVNRVIPGWTEILQKMKVGDKWEVFIPADLAYGEKGSGTKIGPNQALIFEMELLSIEGK